MSPPGRRRDDTGGIREHPCLHRDKPCGSTAHVQCICNKMQNKKVTPAAPKMKVDSSK